MYKRQTHYITKLADAYKVSGDSFYMQDGKAVLPLGTLKMCIRDRSTASTYRDKVLKTEDSASVALKYNDIIAMKRAERSALVKGMDVVYIYHDTIDEASHTSDTAVFAACDLSLIHIYSCFSNDKTEWLLRILYTLCLDVYSKL